MFSNNKHKAITFSFDDGVTQDRRLVKLLDKYNLKCTFNLNSLSLGKEGEVKWQKWTAPHNKVEIEEVKTLYANHEVAVHTSHHPDLTKLSKEKIIKEVEDDRKFLENLVGYKVVGMAYPFGTVNDLVVNTIKENTPILYSRNILSTYNFDLQNNLLDFRPTVHCLDFDHLFNLADQFLHYDGNEDKIFYIWGHAYEFDFEDTWDKFEAFLKLISNKEDIFYGTNKEVLLNGKDLD